MNTTSHPAKRPYRRAMPHSLCGCCLFVCICLVFPNASRAALTYNAALERALEREARHQAEEHDAAAARAEGWRSIAGMGPTLTAYLQPSLNEDRLKRDAVPDLDYSGEDRTTSYHDTEIGITLKQPLLDLERLQTARHGSRQIDLADTMRRKSREDLSVRVAELYYAVVAARDTLAVRQAEEKTLAQQVGAARSRRALGYGTAIDVHDAEARQALAQAATVASRDDLNNARLALQEVLHQEELEELAPSPALEELPRREQSLDFWQQHARDNNIDLQMKDLQAEMARLERQATWARFSPRLHAVGSYTYSNPSESLYYGEEKESEGYIGLRLEMDLLSGGADTAASMAAGRRLQAAQARLEESRRTVARSVQSLWDSLGSTYALAEVYEGAVRANQQAMLATEDGYREGVKVLLDVLDAQQKYYNALNQAQSVRSNYMILYYKFIALTGQNEPAPQKQPHTPDHFPDRGRSQDR